METDHFRREEESPLVQAAKEKLREYFDGCCEGDPRIIALSDMIMVGEALDMWEKGRMGVLQHKEYHRDLEQAGIADSSLRMAERKRVQMDLIINHNISRVNDYLVHYDKIEELHKKLIMAYSESGEKEATVNSKALNDLIEIRREVLYASYHKRHSELLSRPTYMQNG